MLGLVAVESDKPGVGQGQVRVEFKPRLRPIDVGPFHAVASAGPARLGGAGVANEDDFGRLIEHEQADRGIEAGNELAADFEPRPPGSHQ